MEVNIKILSEAVHRFFASASEDDLDKALAAAFVPDQSCGNSVLQNYEQLATFTNFRTSLKSKESLEFLVMKNPEVFSPNDESPSEAANNELALAA